MKIHQKGWFWFLVILALIGVDQIIFHYFFHISYLVWYLKNGALIGAAFTLITLTWDINKNIGLVSANPFHYAGSVQQLVGAQINSFGALGKRKLRKPQNDSVDQVIILDDLVFIVFGILLILLNVLWLIVVLPIQYFFVLFLGGPARNYLSSPVRALAKFEDNKLKTMEIPREEVIPEGWMDLSIANKSVTLTYAIITLVLTVVKYFM